MANLSKDCFAYPQKQMYPVHTKQAALASMAQFEKDINQYTQATINKIAANFIKAANLHNIEYTMTQEPAPEVHKYVSEDGLTLTISKMSSEQDVEKLVKNFEQYRVSLPLNFIKKAALNAYLQADQLDIDCKAMKKLARFAGLGVGDPEQMASQFGKRAGLIEMPEKLKSDFYKTYKSIYDNAAQQDSELYKKASQLCDIMDSIDKMYKLQSYYGDQLKAPQDVCYEESVDDLINEAEDYLRVDSTNTVLSKRALLDHKQKVQNFLKEYYGYDTCEDKDVLSKVASLSETGIKALIKELE